MRPHAPHPGACLRAAGAAARGTAVLAATFAALVTPAPAAPAAPAAGDAAPPGAAAAPLPTATGAAAAPAPATLLAAVISPLSAIPAGASVTDWLERQREAFPAAIRSARAGDEGALAAVDPDYVLYPYLEAAWLEAGLDALPPARLEDYLRRHGSELPARRLRYRWLLALADEGRWAEYLRVWPGVTRPDTVLRCHAVHARLRTVAQPDEALLGDALALWMAGQSQPPACDPVFAFLAEQGALGPAEYRERIRLALANREYGLATYLSRWVGAQERERVARWRDTARDPHSAFARSDLDTLASRDPDWLYLAFDRLAVAHAQDAARYWSELRERVAVPPQTAHAISRRIALSFARDLSPRAAAALDGLEQLDTLTATWRARTAMREQDWPALLYAIDHLPGEEQRSAEWRYWRGRALAGTSQRGPAREMLELAAADRSYHGFLAADLLETDYAFAHRPARPDPDGQARLAALPGIQRAHELWRVGETAAARAEWDAATSRLSVQEKAEAALLAHQWGWHPSAIATAARAALWDDLDLRFPTPYRDTFEYWTSRTGLPLPLALGIARSESLFLEEAVSPAGAMGLMQLMPATGRGVAQRTAVDWRGRQTLLQPDTNIALGTQYLSEVLERLGHHPALAAAAYNAGEHRVNVWLPRQGPIPADAWVDSVPFTETRRYVQRVLMARTIYDWRLGEGRGGTPVRLSERLPPVPTPILLEQAALRR